MTLDLRMVEVVGELGRIADRWWMWPVRGQLRALQAEVALWARDYRAMQRALDEIVDDSREQAQAAETQKRVETVRINSEIERRLKEMAAEHRRLA